MSVSLCMVLFVFFKQKTAYEMRISDWSSDVCSSDLLRPDQRRHASDNREELARAKAALAMAAKGSRVCVVSGGDPGVFAMAAAVCEAIEIGRASCRERVCQYV